MPQTCYNSLQTLERTKDPLLIPFTFSLAAELRVLGDNSICSLNPEDSLSWLLQNKASFSVRQEVQSIIMCLPTLMPVSVSHTKHSDIYLTSLRGSITYFHFSLKTLLKISVRKVFSQQYLKLFPEKINIRKEIFQCGRFSVQECTCRGAGEAQGEPHWRTIGRFQPFLGFQKLIGTSDKRQFSNQEFPVHTSL